MQGPELYRVKSVVAQCLLSNVVIRFSILIIQMYFASLTLYNESSDDDFIDLRWSKNIKKSVVAILDGCYLV